MFNKIILKSSSIVTPNGIIDGYLMIKDEKIFKITDRLLDEDMNVEIIDLSDNSVIPGFVDLHIHGAGGYEVMNGYKDLHAMAKVLANNGITSFYATTSSVSKEDLILILGEIKKAIETHNREKGANIIGIHMEGPFLSIKKKGAMIPEFLLNSSIETMKEFEYASGKYLKRVTVAPELPGTLELIAYLVDKGYIVAGGHTAATYEETMEGIRHGVSIANHMFNAMQGLHHREPGAAGAYLVSDSVICEVISDFVHIHPAVVKLILNCKGLDKTYIISDAISAAGLKPGIYKSGSKEIIVDKNGVSHLTNGITLAGSTCLMNCAFKNIVENIGLSIGEAVKITAVNPAKIAGIYGRTGSLEEEKDADITVLNNKYRTVYCFVKGFMIKKP
jgi:N-acetylglucosamine-6-phosphate deacetylase